MHKSDGYAYSFGEVLEQVKSSNKVKPVQTQSPPKRFQGFQGQQLSLF
jgi:hypothetical protein